MDVVKPVVRLYTCLFGVYVPPRGRINGANCTINRPLSSSFPPVPSPAVDARAAKVDQRARVLAIRKSLIPLWIMEPIMPVAETPCTISERSWRRWHSSSGKNVVQTSRPPWENERIARTLRSFLGARKIRGIFLRFCT